MPSKPISIALGALLLLTYLALVRWPAERQVRAKQENLLMAVQDASWGRCKKLISDSYKDHWGWNHDDLVLVMKDLRSQFIVLALTMNESVQTVTDGKRTVVTKLQVSGKPFGLGGTIERRINSLDDPATFTWTKESIWPWSWRLTQIHHPDATVTDGYTPGDLLRLSKGDFDL